MKRKNTLWSLVLALVMVLGVIAPLGALAASDATETKTVTLHKLMMTKDKLKAWDSDKIEEAGYNGSQDLAALRALEGVGQDVREVPDVFFAWQEVGKEKVADKDQYIKGEVVDGVMTPVFDGDNLVYTTNIDEAFGGKTKDNGIKFDTTKLKGSFLIQEIKEKSTYKTDDGMVIAGQKAIPVEITLPLVNEEGVVENAHVYPKNTQEKPKIDKNFAKKNGLTAIEDAEGNINAGADIANYDKAKAKAQAEVGKKIPYEVVTKIDADTSYERLIWNDIMTNGLTFNKDVKVEADNNISLALDVDYKLAQDDNGFRLQMTDAGLAKIKAVTTGADAKDVNIKLTYSATVNGTAVVDNPEKNNVKLEYGHKKGEDLKKNDVTPKDGKLNVVKNFSEGAKTDGLKLVYTLEKDGKAVASVALDNTITNKTIDLGNGIKFVVGKKAFNGEFTGLGEDAAGWKISERVAGYNPAYAETDVAGTVTITNNEDKDNPTPLEPTTPEVVVGGKKFVKTTEVATELLAGAKFVVKNGENKYLSAKSVDTVEAEKAKLAAAQKALNDAVKAYNERQEGADETQLKADIDAAQKTYNEAFKTAGIRYEWVPDKNAAGVVELSSNSKGQFMIEGIEYGTYKLEEIEAPKGYAKINDVEFTVAKGNTKDVNIKYAADSAESDAKQVINKKVTIPQTGGMGTMIFMVAGLALMGGAFIAMRKRSAEQA